MSLRIDDFAEMNITCLRCGALPGFRCQTKTGKPATYPHGSRTSPISAAWVAGWEEGRNEILDSIIDQNVWLDADVNRRRQQRRAS